MNALEQYNEIAVKIPELKLLFEKEIVDQTKPLEERWDYWCKAPDALKNEEPYIKRFDSEKLLPDGRIDWYDDFGIERRRVVDLCVFLDEHVLDVWNGEEHWADGWNEQIRDAFREEVLAKNLGSFVMDW